MVLQSLAHSDRGQVDDRTRVYEPVVLEKCAGVVKRVLRGPLVVGEKTELIDSLRGSVPDHRSPLPPQGRTRGGEHNSGKH